VPVTLVDTAGLRTRAADAVELEGMDRTRGAAAVADLLLVVFDRSRAYDSEDAQLLDETAAKPRLIVASKSDLPTLWTPGAIDGIVAVAASDGRGLDELRTRILSALGSGAESDTPAITNLRHTALLERAHAALRRAADAARSVAPEEFVAADVTEARHAIEEVTGRRTADDTLAAIFSRFCIGK